MENDKTILQNKQVFVGAIEVRYSNLNGKREGSGAPRYDAATGIVTVPVAYRDTADTLGIVFELSPAHKAYERYVTADLDTSDVTVDFAVGDITFQSDIDDVVAQAEHAEPSPLKASRAGAFPGTANKRYQLNAYTRLENFDVDD